MSVHLHNKTLRRSAVLITAAALMTGAVQPLLSDAAHTGDTSAGAYTADEAAADITADTEDTEQFTDITASDETAQTEDAGYIVSGDYSYSYTTEGNIRIEACTSAESKLTVPDTIDGLPVTELGKSALSDIPAVSVALPATIEYISADNPFIQCESLQEITVDPANEYYTADAGVLFSKDKTLLLCYPQAKNGISYVIPEGVEQVGTAAFYNSVLSGITFPSTLSSLGRHSLSYCGHLTTADLSGTKLSLIDIMAFTMDTALNSVKLPETLYEIGGGAFYGCSSLKEIALPQSLHFIGQSAFAGTALEKVDIPDSVESIGYSAFGYDADDDPVDGFIVIGSAESAASVYASDSDEEYDYENNFTFLTREEAEDEMAYLEMETVTSGEYVYTVNDDGTAGIVLCTSVSSNIDVPAEIDGLKVTSIVKRAFMASQAVTITLPDTVKTIGDDAFFQCTYLEKLNIPSGCAIIEGDEPFFTCTALREINITGGSSGSYSSVDGVLFDKGMTKLICYPRGRTEESYTVPASVREVGYSAFSGCSLKSVDLSDVTSIAACAFDNCTSLERVKLSRELETVGNDAFYNCTSLGSVRLYNKLTAIGDYAFGYFYNEEQETGEEEDTDIFSELLGGETEEETDRSVLVDGFKIYAAKDSLGWKYAQACGIETVTGTVAIGSHNVSIPFLIVCGSLLLLLILIAAITAAVKRARIRKAEKNTADIKEKAARMMRERRAAEEQAGKGDDRNEDK
ncbi:MAG: leucine-rich repeat protein [Ruminococcus sp.]|nr:leucine-rich repeat protein [Ruminococcus sp.]